MMCTSRSDTSIVHILYIMQEIKTTGLHNSTCIIVHYSNVHRAITLEKVNKVQSDSDSRFLYLHVKVCEQ